jgi:hypothetical protein
MLLAAACLAGILIQGCSQSQTTAKKDPTQYSSPEEAVQALTNALRADDKAQLMVIMGSGGDRIISSGDEVADQQRRQEFLKLYDQKHALSSEGPDKMTLVIGDTDWPFPVPIVRHDKTWSFDCAAGEEEILNRRIGRDELDAIQVCEAIGDAQKEYALRDPMGHGVHEYAQKFASDDGLRDGLFWKTADGEEPSPLGELAAQASAEGYKRQQGGPTAYHGYLYRILKAQGPDAPGGALNFVVNDKMTLGFAIVAYPAEYGNSGVMTFVMDDEGVVYQKDLGDQTAKLASDMNTFNPDPTWKKVQ